MTNPPPYKCKHGCERDEVMDKLNAAEKMWADATIYSKERDDIISELRASNRELCAALDGCMDHMEWSTPQGREAYRTALEVTRKIQKAIRAVPVRAGLEPGEVVALDDAPAEVLRDLVKLYRKAFSQKFAQLAAAEQERDKWKLDWYQLQDRAKKIAGQRDAAQQDLDEWANHAGPYKDAKIEVLTAKLAAAQEALRPFAEAAGCCDDIEPDHGEIWEHASATMITVGDLRRAASVLEHAVLATGEASK